MKWLLERRLRPKALEPEAEQLVRGDYAHNVLQRVYSELKARGHQRVTRANLAEAERLLLDALREFQAEFPISPDRTRVRTAVRKLEFDLLRYLRDEADSASSFEPDELELSFGGDGGEPVSIGIEGLSLIGRIDRVDTHGTRALVRDYKTGRSRADYGASKWIDENRLQIAVYMLALAEVRPELEVVAGVYDPLAGSKPTRAACCSTTRVTISARAGRRPTGATGRGSTRSSTRRARPSRGARPDAHRRRPALPRLVRMERRLLVSRDLQARVVSVELTPRAARGRRASAAPGCSSTRTRAAGRRASWSSGSSAPSSRTASRSTASSRSRSLRRPPPS